MMMFFLGHQTKSELPKDLQGLPAKFLTVKGDGVPDIEITRVHEGEYSKAIPPQELADLLGAPDAAKYTEIVWH